jgi:hypothetical protein
MSTATTTAPAAEPDAPGIYPVLREDFAPELVGKLPRVTCSRCSHKDNRTGTCEDHPEKVKCGECKSWISPKHTHLDFVGHADVTDRLLDADPHWAWEPKARDIDPSALAAALATGNPEIVQMVYDNAPPKYELDDKGNPVGFWIRLTVGGDTRLGYGSVPSNQRDAVKVLIGDALRNAAMRFGVALHLWSKADRDDPSVENATANAGSPGRRGRAQSAGDAWEDARPAQPRNHQQRPAPQPVRLADDDSWKDKIDDLTTTDEANAAWAEIVELRDAGTIDDARSRQLRAAIQYQMATRSRQLRAEIQSQMATRTGMAESEPQDDPWQAPPPATPPADGNGQPATRPSRIRPEDQGARKPAPPAGEDDDDWVTDWNGRLHRATLDDLGGLQKQIGAAVMDKTITPSTAQDLAGLLREHRKVLNKAPAA